MEVALVVGEFGCHPGVVVLEPAKGCVVLGEECSPAVVVVGAEDINRVGFGQFGSVFDDEKVFVVLPLADREKLWLPVMTVAPGRRGR